MLVWLHTGSPLPPSGQDSIWFHTGLLTLLVGLFLVEYRLTRPNDVFVNCLVVFTSTSTLAEIPLEQWWSLLRWGAVLVGSVALYLSWDPGFEARLANSRSRSVAYQIVTRLGSASVIFSLVFILSLLTFFELDTIQTRVFVITWGIFLLVSSIDLRRLIGILRRSSRGERQVLGTVHSFLAPSIVFCRQIGEEPPTLHQLVGFTRGLDQKCVAAGIMVGERSSAGETRLAIALLNTTVSESRINDRSLMVTVSDHERSELQPPITDDDVSTLERVVGTVAADTNISRLKFELFGRPPIAAGALLRVDTAERPIFYQVFDGEVFEETTLSESQRAFVVGEAEQVGVWDAIKGGFDTHDWVARERAPVLLVDQSTTPDAHELASSELTLGMIPRSNYQVNVDLSDLVLFHTAILGVTGSGKSYLTYRLVEAAASMGIKSVCIDPSGDYQRYLSGAVLLRGSSALKAFLDSETHMIGIIETSEGQKHPIEQAFNASKSCLDWCRAHRTTSDILSPRPKVQIVLEEAHLLVPEFNFNPQSDMQSYVSKTSQIVLQARKYGLGFLVISQRTANVVKSILNQCNTIVSFQGFDETGFDFLRNYMGPFHVRSLPNLKMRHAMLVGKASRSRRPLMVHLTEQDRELRAEPISDMPMPQVALETAAAAGIAPTSTPP